MAIEEESRVHPDCINASNPYHECVEYCFFKIAEAKKRLEEDLSDGSEKHGCGLKRKAAENDTQDTRYMAPDELKPMENMSVSNEVAPDAKGDSNEDLQVQNFSHLSERQKKLFELRLRRNEARKANQTEILAEKKREEAPSVPRGMSKQKWIEERKKVIGKQLDANGLDITKAYMLDTEEAAEEKYKKWEKEPAPFGWDVFNQKSLYKAYKKRTKNISVNMDEYLKNKESDPEFYRDDSSLQYGKAPKLPDENIERMVNELKEREEKRKSFSRRRRFHDEKDIDSINDRNEHFNKKIERAFGKYTIEIKNNLERGTALPD
eukprot:TRINITY_DN6182_c0_g1_i1.p1 TRINITY_DN6182_c0_g1~~TRINITY_DN6182_c0_g1_i1.p1  ORF type:complete len:321 (+),score=102.18 TRINITY_DN6182_c0_g1_i1:421-1383(+)